MGRLTLNILLSFAQFEREVIGESIRDKIAASKRKPSGGEMGLVCRFMTHSQWLRRHSVRERERVRCAAWYIASLRVGFR
jgi:DNA invertase Pin-like site-specific DNA recombinase